MYCRLAVPLILLMLSSPAVAASAELPSMGSMFMQMVWALLVVTGLILVLYALLRKKMGYSGSATSRIKVMEIRPVLPKNSLALVRVDNREILIGISTNGMHLLTEFSSVPEEKTFETVLKEEQ